MTFDEFQATRERCEDLQSALNIDMDGASNRGFIYAWARGCGFYIEDSTPDFLERGRYYMMIEREEYVSDRLELLERILYHWCKDQWGK